MREKNQQSITKKNKNAIVNFNEAHINSKHSTIYVYVFIVIWYKQSGIGFSLHHFRFLFLVYFVFCSPQPVFFLFVELFFCSVFRELQHIKHHITYTHTYTHIDKHRRSNNCYGHHRLCGAHKSQWWYECEQVEIARAKKVNKFKENIYFKRSKPKTQKNAREEIFIFSLIHFFFFFVLFELFFFCFLHFVWILFIFLHCFRWRQWWWRRWCDVVLAESVNGSPALSRIFCVRVCNTLFNIFA